MHRMLQLTREVRFTLHPGRPTAALNGLSGNLANGPGMYLVLQVSLEGPLDPASNYIENVKVIDDRVRNEVQPAMAQLIAADRFTGARAAMRAAEILSTGWQHARLVSVRLFVNPYLSYGTVPKELPMVRVTQRFEFSAAHRLHNPALSDAENIRTFGKCNNAEGHGHNYEFEVTLQGSVDGDGRLIDLQQFQAIVNDTVIVHFDHKHLNRQTTEFAETLPSVENIAAVIFRLLDNRFPGSARLQSIRVWETNKTWAECSR